MSMNRLNNLVETAKKIATPVTVVGLFAIAGCSDDDPGSTQEELQRIFDTATEQCDDLAQQRFDEEYPKVKISNSPDVKELTEALAAMESRETEGDDFRKKEFDACMDLNYFGFEPVVDQTTTSMTPTTTVGN